MFTLALMALPHTPATFAVALVGENVFQGAAFSVQFAIILRTIGNDNHFAATQFALLIAVTEVPLTYMQAIDGNAYGFGGLLECMPLTDCWPWERPRAWAYCSGSPTGAAGRDKRSQSHERSSAQYQAASTLDLSVADIHRVIPPT